MKRNEDVFVLSPPLLLLCLTTTPLDIFRVPKTYPYCDPTIYLETSHYNLHCNTFIGVQCIIFAYFVILLLLEQAKLSTQGPHVVL